MAADFTQGAGNRPLRYAELFAGAGGLSLGLDRAGFECAWHAEIADFPRRVLKHRWPHVPLYGDVAELNGYELVERHGPIDLLSGGSPCQDLSVAGKRAGMAEGSGTRSSLFFEQLRIWNETGAELLLWENVNGARSSNKRKDFAAVLSAIVGDPVNVPAKTWRSGGVAAGRSGIAAWRVLDAQFFGVPQRRRRIFVLCSRTGRVDPAEILSLSEGLRGNPETSGETREGFAGSAGNGVEGKGRIAATLVSPGQQFNSFQNLPNLVVEDCTSATGSIAHSLRADGYGASEDGSGRGTPIVTEAVRLFAVAHGEARERNVASCIPANSGPNRHGEGAWSATQFDAVLSFAQNQRGELRMSEVDTSLNSGGGKPGEGYPAVLAFENHGQDSRFNQLESAFPAINGHAGTGGNNLPLILDYATPALDRSKTPAVLANETGHESWRMEVVAGSLNAHEAKEAHSLVIPAPMMVNISNGEPRLQEVCASLQAGENSGGIGSGQQMQAVFPTHGIPRRLMPIECERLMSWPDNWTNVPDEKGKPASDAARYKACGNGVASNCIQWIAERLRVSVEDKPTVSE